MDELTLPNTPINETFFNSSTEGAGNTVVVPAEALGNNSGLKFSPSTNSVQPTLQSLLQTSQGLVETNQNTLNQLNSDDNFLTQRIAELQGQSANRGAETLALEDQAGIDKQQKELNDLLGVINQRSNALRLRDVTDEQDLTSLEGIEGSGQLLSGVNRNQRLLKREQLLRRTAEGVELGSLISNAQLIQGNIQQARDTIARKIDLKYGDMETRLNSLKFFLERNDSKLSDAQRALAEERKTQINFQLQAINDAKDQEFRIAELKEQAALAGADIDTLNRLDKAGSVEEAQRIVNPLLSRNAQRDQAQNDALFNAQLSSLQLSNRQKVQELKNIVNSVPIEDIVGSQEFKALESDDQLDILLDDESIPQGIRTNIGDVLSVVEQVKALADINPDGNFEGLSPVRLVPNQLRSEGAINNQQYIESINLLTQRWASGAALTEAQTKQVARITPTKGDTDKQVRAKINGLIDFMMADINGKLRAAGVSEFSPTPSDIFGDTFNTILQDDEFNSIYDTAGSTTSSFNAASFF